MVPALGLIGLQAASSLAGGLSDALSPKADKTRRTAQDFETMFMEQVFDRMTEGAGEDGPLGEGGTGGGVYRSMLAKEYAGQVVRSGGVGIADQVYRQLLQLQEGAGHGAG